MAHVPPNGRPPTPEEIREKAAKHHITLSDAEVADFAGVIEKRLAGLRTAGRAPGPAEVELTVLSNG